MYRTAGASGSEDDEDGPKLTCRVNNQAYPPTLEPVIPELRPLMLRQQENYDKFVTEEAPDEDEEEDSEIPEAVKS